MNPRRQTHSNSVAAIDFVFDVIRHMDVDINHIGFESYHLHEVNFTAGGPADNRRIGAQHPDRRPDPAAGRQFGANFNPPVFPTLKPFHSQTRRSVSGKFPAALPITRALGRRIIGGIAKALFSRLDDQHPVFDARICCAPTGVILSFVIAEKSGFVIPFRGIGQAGVVEFIGPNQLPFRGKRGAGNKQTNARQ